MIVAEVRGIGTKTTGVTLTNSLGVDICQTVSIPKYGQLLCLTKENMAFATVDSLKLKVAANLIDCSATGACDYQTSSAENMPLVTSVSKVDAVTLQFIGTGFQLLPDFTSRVRYLGIEASDVSIGLDDTTVTATFLNGVPLSNITHKALLYYVLESTGVQHYA